MNRVIIRLDALRHNLHVIDGWIREHGASWTVVTKVLCGHRDTLRARSMGDSRLGNVSALLETIPEAGLDTWYLRVRVRLVWSGGPWRLRPGHANALRPERFCPWGCGSAKWPWWPWPR
jgi:hypothetical protein